MYVFRTGRRRLPASSFKEALAQDLTALAGRQGGEPPEDLLVGTLVRAGALECAVADAGLECPAAAEVTDCAAEAFASGLFAAEAAARLARVVRALECPAMLEASPAEGFAYYALHPAKFGELARAVLPSAGRPAVVIGIRTVGVTLGAVVRATLRSAGCEAVRFTVRPEGAPHGRTLRLAPLERRLCREAAARRAQFFVVDEGPGQSGSSFLCAAEALVALGIDPADITLMCSRPVDPSTLLARDGPRRWRRFVAVWPDSRLTCPGDAGRWLGSGAWRALVVPERSAWPVCWTVVERAKFLSADGQRVYKFEGLGPYGAAAHVRAATLSAAGFLPAGAGELAGRGYLSYPLLRGRPLARHDLSRTIIEWMADYCAYRGALLSPASVDIRPIEEMMRVNAALELEVSPVGGLEVERPVVPDARMAPHEFFLAEDRRLYKLDSASDGDDHLLPGPCDVAWDLAGAIFEWDLSPGGEQVLVDRYRRQSGDDARRRLPAYVAAYALFRTAYWRMAAQVETGPEKGRLRAAYQRARARLVRRFASASSAAAAPLTVCAAAQGDG